MKSKELELYSDYLIASSGQATATGLAEVLDQAISHDLGCRNTATLSIF
jgi:hypothetical protein